MIVYLVGHKGWIGGMYIELFNKMNITYYTSEYRGESDEIKTDILEKKPTHILCCMGRTHGVFNGVQYNTIDYLQNNETLKENINDNLYVPLNLALFAKSNNIHFTYMGTGCIFSYDTHYSTTNRVKEEDIPNFFGSNYSIVKGFTDMLMKQTDALVLRIRMPITCKNNPRNFITKILKYKNICSLPNSMSVLDDLLPLSLEMMNNMEMGCFNFTNPGPIDHNMILTMYRDMIDSSFKWENFTIEEQNKVLSAERSNNTLDTTKLESKYKIDCIVDSMKRVFENWVP